VCDAFVKHQFDSTKKRVLDQLGSAQRFVSRSDAVQASGAAFEILRSLPARSVFLLQPVLEELEHQPVPQWDGLLDEVRREAPKIKFITMQNSMEKYLVGTRKPQDPVYHGMGRLDILKLPQAEQPEIYTWFFLPSDQHYTDKAVALYAEAICEYFIGDFLNEKSK
jgi:hypothetical protein